MFWKFLGVASDRANERAVDSNVKGDQIRASLPQPRPHLNLCCYVLPPSDVSPAQLIFSLLAQNFFEKYNVFGYLNMKEVGQSVVTCQIYWQTGYNFHLHGQLVAEGKPYKPTSQLYKTYNRS